MSEFLERQLRTTLCINSKSHLFREEIQWQFRIWGSIPDEIRVWTNSNDTPNLPAWNIHRE